MPEIQISENQRERLEGVRSEVEDAFVDTYGHTRIEDAVEYLLDTYTPPGEAESGGAYDRIATATYSELQHVAGETPEVPGSGLDADEMRGRLLSELGAEEFAARLEATGTNGGNERAPEGDRDADVDDEKAEADSDGDESDAVVEENSTVGEGDENAEANSDSGESDETAEANSDGEGGDTKADAGPSPNVGGIAAGSGTDGEAIQADSVVRVGTGDADGDGDSAPSAEEGSESTPAAGGSPVAAANQLLRDHDDKWRESASDAPYEVDLPDGTTASARTKDDVRQLLFRHY